MSDELCPICVELDDFDVQPLFECSGCHHRYCEDHFEYNDGTKQLCDNCFEWTDYPLDELNKHARKYYWDEEGHYTVTELKIPLKIK